VILIPDALKVIFPHREMEAQFSFALLTGILCQ
jgi:hypothetical protein